MAGPSSPPIFQRGSFPSNEVEDKYNKRLRLLTAYIGNPDHFHLHSIIMGNPAKCEIYLSEFAEWAVSVMKWGDLPPELAAMAEKKVTQSTAPAAKVEASNDETLAALFDPVPVEALEKMFPAGGQWKGWAEKASSNGLVEARPERAKFNPYKAGVWFVNKGVDGWDLNRCHRVLANNLPARSMDDRHQLTGDIE